MCPPPAHARFIDKLRHGWRNSYYRYATAYLLIVNTVIMIEVILMERHAT